MRFVCNLPRIMRLFDFGRNYAKNYASIIRQGLTVSKCIRMKEANGTLEENRGQGGHWQMDANRI